MANSICSNPTRKRGIKIYNKTLGKSVYRAKGKMTMKKSSLINASYQVVEVPSSIIAHCGSA